MVILEKNCCIPSIYNESGTSASKVHARISNHHDGRLTPRYVQATKDNCYVITHYTLLVHSIIPDPEHRPRVRTAMLILELSLSGLMWSIGPRKAPYRLEQASIWPRSPYSWTGPIVTVGLHLSP